MSAIQESSGIFAYQNLGVKRELERKNLNYTYDELLYESRGLNDENDQESKFRDASIKKTSTLVLNASKNIYFYDSGNVKSGVFESASHLIEMQLLRKSSSVSALLPASSRAAIMHYDSAEQLGHDIAYGRKDIPHANSDKNLPDKTAIFVITKNFKTSIWIRDFSNMLNRSDILAIYSSIKRSLRNVLGGSIRLMINAVVNK